MKNKTVVFVTNKGIVLRTPYAKDGSIQELMQVETGDKIRDVILVRSDDDLVILTKRGMVLRFPVSDMRILKPTAAGVMGITLEPKDSVDQLICIHKENKGPYMWKESPQLRDKTIDPDRLPARHRGGKGVKAKDYLLEWVEINDA